jgi:hypothetical protein
LGDWVLSRGASGAALALVCLARVGWVGGWVVGWLDDWVKSAAMSEKCDLPAETAAKADEECDKECEWRRVKPLTPFDRYNSSLHSPLSMKSAMKPIRIALQYYKLSRFMYTSTPTIVTTDGSTHPSLCSNRIFPRKLLSSNLTLFILYSLERDCVRHANVASAVRFRPPNATVSTGSDATSRLTIVEGVATPSADVVGSRISQKIERSSPRSLHNPAVGVHDFSESVPSSTPKQATMIRAGERAHAEASRIGERNATQSPLPRQNKSGATS